MFMCNFLAAGPTVAIVETAMDFFPNAGKEGLGGAISQTAYFFTSTALLQGVGNFFWMPLVNKYGRRPVYLASYTIYFGVALWLSFTTTYDSFLAARIIMGFASGAAETMAPLSIADGKLRNNKSEDILANISSFLPPRTRSGYGVSIKV